MAEKSLENLEIVAAQPSDYLDVLGLQPNMHWGTDTLSGLYFKYLQDTERGYCVAKLSNRVVAFAGGRVTDAGETFEPNAARTASELRGLGLYQQVRQYLVEQIMQPRFPALRRIRLVTAASEEILNKPEMFRIIPYLQRAMFNIVFKMPTVDFLRKTNHLTSEKSSPYGQPVPCYKEELRGILTDDSTNKTLFPGNLLVREHESFLIGPEYLTNVQQIFDEYSTAFWTKTSTKIASNNVSVSAISFCRRMIAGDKLDLYMCCIDYYSAFEDMSLLSSHLKKHISDVRTSVAMLKGDVSCVVIQLYLPVRLISCETRSHLYNVVQNELHLPVTENLDSGFRQVVVDVLKPREQLKSSSL